MMRRLGHARIARGIGPTTNRTCRLANATPERLRELIAANLERLVGVLRYSLRLNVRFFRVSSMVIPLASHPVNTVGFNLASLRSSSASRELSTAIA